MSILNNLRFRLSFCFLSDIREEKEEGSENEPLDSKASIARIPLAVFADRSERSPSGRFTAIGDGNCIGEEVRVRYECIRFGAVPGGEMHSRSSNNRLSGSAFLSRISTLLFSMFATMASFYVAGRLWQDSQDRVYLITELDRRTGQGKSVITVDETLKIITCREQRKKLIALEMDLAKARVEGFVPRYSSDNGGTHTKKKILAVIGIITRFGRKDNRDAIRKAWMPTGAALKKLQEEKGIVIRFVIGRSANLGDSLDREIDNENGQNNDFIILKDHIEDPNEHPKKTKLFFAHALEHWDAEFYAKVNDDIYVNIDALGATLANHLDKPRAYIGCMKSGEVFSEQSLKWYEPDWWKFGDGKSYFRHASGEIFAITRALAQFISINRLNLRTYAHDDISAGSWFIGLDVKHIDEGKFCCSSWSSGAICAAA